MRWRALVTCVAVLLGVESVRADEGELHVGLLPTLVAMNRYERWNTGAGLHAQVSFGLLDYLELGGDIGCARVDSLAKPVNAEQRIFYDATQCEAVPTVVGRFGAQTILLVLAGVGYRFESRANRDVVGTNGILLQRLESRTIHQVVGRLGLAFEYRWFDRWSVQAQCRASKSFSSPDSGLEIAGGVFLGIYFYPY